jgi:hypothetical protein
MNNPEAGSEAAPRRESPAARLRYAPTGSFSRRLGSRRPRPPGRHAPGSGPSTGRASGDNHRGLASPVLGPTP